MTIATLTLVAPAIATSQSAPPPGQEINTQLQLGDIFAAQTLQVVSADQGMSVSAISSGNVVAATQVGASLQLTSSQTNSGKVGALSSAATDNGAGPAMNVQASATANTATAGSSDGVTSGGSYQVVTRGADISANASGSTSNGPTSSASIAASAIGNSQGWSANGGAISSGTTQVASSLVQSSAQAVLCCTTDHSTITSTSVSNNVTADTLSSTVYLEVTQTRDPGLTTASATAIQTSGRDVSANATSTANNVNSSGTGDWTTMRVAQTNTGDATASADTTVTNWSGSADAGAYALGNSTFVSNAGSTINLTAQETNTGGISAQANLTGGSNGVGSSSATAVGNAASAYTCGACGSGVGANISQTNSGNVHATSTVNGQVGQVAVAASAIGNSLTIQASPH